MKSSRAPESSVDDAGVVLQDFLGVIPAAPGDQEHKVARRVAQDRVGPVEDTSQPTRCGINQQVLGRKVVMDERQLAVIAHRKIDLPGPAHRLVDHRIATA